MRLLVTGCRGFIGGSFGRYAAAQGHEILGIGRTAQPPEDWPGKYAPADVAHADLAVLIREYQPDVLFHGAGSASVGASFSAPPEDLRATVQTFSNVLDSVRRSGVAPLVIFPSSAAVYGNPASLPVSEEAAVQPLSPYGFHKAMCELLAQQYAACFGLRVLICRLFSVYGPAQKRLLVHQLFAQLESGAPELRLEGTGEETRDYLYINDLSAAVLALADAELPQRQAAACTIVNVASGETTRIGQLAETLARLHGSGKRVVAAGRPRLGDPRHWQAGIERLRERVALPPPCSLEAGLRECLSAWQKPSA
jgi:UDP-glucose 4-epimerase